MSGGSRLRPIRHGTNAGYAAHLRRGIPVCDDCAAAHREYQRRTRPARPEPEPVPCTVCGLEFHPRGVRAHEARCTGRRRRTATQHATGGTPVGPVGSAGRPDREPDVVLVCQCGHVTGSVARLVNHTLTAHRRGPTRDERTPRTDRSAV